MKRTVRELQEAATDAGWSGDPLAAEILDALALLERENLEGKGASPRTSKSSVAAWIGVVVLSVVVGWQAVDNHRLVKQADMAAAVEKIAASNDQLKAVVGEAGGKIKAAVDTSADLSRISVSAAEANQEMLKIYSAKVQELQLELDRLRAAQVPVAPVLPPAKQTVPPATKP